MKFFISFCLIILSACSATGPKFTPYGKPHEGKALIYVYRPSRMAGIVHSYDMMIDDKKVGELPNNGYFTVEVASGEHIAALHGMDGNWGAFPFSVIAGDAYYLRMDQSAPNLSEKYVALPFRSATATEPERCHTGNGKRLSHLNKDATTILENMDTRAQKSSCTSAFLFVVESFAAPEIVDTKLTLGQ